MPEFMCSLCLGNSSAVLSTTAGVHVLPLGFSGPESDVMKSVKLVAPD